MVWLLIFMGFMEFIRFFIHEVLCDGLRYDICSTWFYRMRY